MSQTSIFDGSRIRILFESYHKEAVQSIGRRARGAVGGPRGALCGVQSVVVGVGDRLADGGDGLVAVRVRADGGEAVQVVVVARVAGVGQGVRAGQVHRLLALQVGATLSRVGRAVGHHGRGGGPGGAGTRECRAGSHHREEDHLQHNMLSTTS